MSTRTYVGIGVTMAFVSVLFAAFEIGACDRRWWMLGALTWIAAAVIVAVGDMLDKGGPR